MAADGYLDSRARLGGNVGAVIGGGGGIGAAISLSLARAGLDLAVCDIDQAALEQTASAIRQVGQRIMAMPVDVMSTGALDEFFDQIEREFSRLDVVVNVAGGTRRVEFSALSQEEIEADIRRNYGYVVQSVQRSIPLIRRSGEGGSIINLTTIEAHRGAAGFAVYAGAKAATANFTRAMAVELGKDRIRLNCIAPDTTPSQGNTKALPAHFCEAFQHLSAEAQLQGLSMYVPCGEPPPADAIADAVLFLSSDLSK
ncbi:MAG: SDR family oxidoreductase, partial [Pseudomonadales bacterium]|nr:SDR family oxidoreductase [Pseudomonadales bacterium]